MFLKRRSHVCDYINKTDWYYDDSAKDYIYSHYWAFSDVEPKYWVKNEDIFIKCELEVEKKTAQGFRLLRMTQTPPEKIYVSIKENN